MIWHPARWPLRTRVAMAFLAATGLALTLFGAFVHVRLGAALEARLRETIVAEADRLEAVPASRRLEAVQSLGGEVHAQVVTAQGEVRGSSRLVAGPLLGSATGDEVTAPGPRWRESTVTILDDDAAAEGREDPESEPLVLLIRPGEAGTLVVGASREEVDEAVAELRNQLLIAGPLALALAGGLGYIVAGAGLRPIERMRTHAASISARTAEERLPLPLADDELRRLAQTINEMLERLDEGLRRERRFVAEASHDLRTPLTLMLTEIELALGRPRQPEELTAALHSVQDEVRRLVALAAELLDRAGAAQTTLPIEARPVDLGELAHRVADRFRPSAGGRAVTVTTHRTPVVPGDLVRLDRALSNLVDNALRHGAGEVAIEVGATGSGAFVAVTDHGDRLTADTHTDGLGLSIVREIAQAHGGAVAVSPAGELTVARLDLPAMPPP